MERSDRKDGWLKWWFPRSMKPGMEAVDDGQLHDSTQP